MKQCPHCKAIVSPLRFLRHSPHRCQKCGGVSVHDNKWTEFHKILAGLLAAAGAGLGYQRVPLLEHSTFWLIVTTIVLFVLGFAFIDWTLGRMMPCRKEDVTTSPEPSGSGVVDGSCEESIGPSSTQSEGINISPANETASQNHTSNRCPHCRARASLRWLWQRPYVCPKCGGRSTYEAPLAGIDALVAVVVTDLLTWILCNLVGWDREFFMKHPSAEIWWYGVFAVQIGFWLVFLRWFFGRLSPLPNRD